jgi:hypothetical protein
LTFMKSWKLEKCSWELVVFLETLRDNSNSTTIKEWRLI